ncbi:ig-like domain-containing protein [Caerostris extrusa]|uniref:Ig-like domain-containing protein n=1 Tax=Caerostris extrusa TaxID=172846 RepID=A0AAV4Q375_CAEEX|nr:ig-like domain-containing protein [Caerostris extrusa]
MTSTSFPLLFPLPPEENPINPKEEAAKQIDPKADRAKLNDQHNFPFPIFYHRKKIPISPKEEAAKKLYLEADRVCREEENDYQTRVSEINYRPFSYILLAFQFEIPFNAGALETNAFRMSNVNNKNTTMYEIPFTARALIPYTFRMSKVNDKNTTMYLLPSGELPEHQVGKEDTDFMVLCNVRSDPSPIISWYVNNSLILMVRPKYTITEDGLFIRSLKPTDSGNYTCRAFVVTLTVLR